MKRFLSQLICLLVVLSLAHQPVWAQARSLEKSSNSPFSGGTGSGNESKISNLRDSDKNNEQEGISISGGQTSGGGEFGAQMIRVHVLGDVQNPGTFTIPVSQRMYDVLKLSAPNRQKYRVVQIRHDGEKTRFYDLYQYLHFGNLKHNPYVRDNDVIFVPEHHGMVRIEGPVLRPGMYELNGEKSLYQIVSLSGGFAHAASKSHPIKVIRFDEAGKRLVLDVVATKKSMKLFRIEKGDTVVVQDIINAGKPFDYSVESIPGENLVYPTSLPDVFVIGAVGSPGPYPYKAHLKIKDYVAFAGAGRDSHLGSVKVLRNGKKKRRKLHDKVQAGDVIIVRERNFEVFLKYLGVASTIMSFTTSTILFKEFIENR